MVRRDRVLCFVSILFGKKTNDEVIMGKQNRWMIWMD